MCDTYCERSTQKWEPTNSCKVSWKKQHHSILHFPFNPPKVIQKLRIPNSTLPWPWCQDESPGSTHDFLGCERLRSWKVRDRMSECERQLSPSHLHFRPVTNLLLFTSSRSSNMLLNVQHPDVPWPLAHSSCKVVSHWLRNNSERI